MYENVAFALEVTGTPRRQIRPAVERVIALVGLTGQVKQPPRPGRRAASSSGRRSPARSSTTRGYIIADEPTGNLDPVITEIIRAAADQRRRDGPHGHPQRRGRHRAGKRVVALEDGRIIRDETGAAYHRED